MSRARSGGSVPLPAGWEEAKAPDGKTYFIDHNTRKTSWIDPRDKLNKPKTFADCIGSELPLGWEECQDDVIGTYYIDHINENNQIEDPRQQWHEDQQEMLNEYVLKGKMAMKEQEKILSVKQRRLDLAQEKVDYLTNKLGELNEEEEEEEEKEEKEEFDEISVTSIEAEEDTISTDSNMNKYNAEQLKDDIATARERVENLRKELHKASNEVRHKQEGFDKLEQINRNLSENGPYQIDMARDKLNEMKNVKEKLLQGEQEKIRLLQDLLKQRDEYQYGDYINRQTKSAAGSQTSLNSVGSAGAMSPLDGSEENLFSSVSKKQLRKDYQLALQRVDELHASLELCEHFLNENKNGAEQHRILLLNEKEALVNEIERFEMYIRTEEERIQLEYEKEVLLKDLLSAREISNKVIEDRTQLENERKILQQQLQQKIRQTNLLESKLKSLSNSSLSVSSTSSRGSISASSRGSLSASSRGSLNSINFHAETNEHTLTGYCHHLTNCPPIYESHILATKAETTEGLASISNGYHSPFTTHSNRGDITSMSPPTIDQNIPTSRNASSQLFSNDDQSYISYSKIPLQNYPFSMGSNNDISQGINYYVYNATSNESVASDSGVFEPSRTFKSTVTRQDSGHSSGVYCSEDNIETAQIRVGLNYQMKENKLVVSVEKARNIKSLSFQTIDFVYLKGRLLPQSSSSNKYKFKTRKSNAVDTPLFNEQFLFKLERTKLHSKTLQLDIYGMVHGNKKENCLGGMQISLADFDADHKSPLKWYNLLGSSFMGQVPNSGSLERSGSSVSLESMQARFSTLPRVIADAQTDDLPDGLHHYRLRSNSWQDKISLGSQNSTESSSVSGSVERLPLVTPFTNSLLLQHARSKSEESEQQQIDVNVNRSISDCTGCRRSFRVPFERMAPGRRSVRQNKLHQKLNLSPLSGFSPSQNRRDPPVTSKPQIKHQNMTSMDLEMELQAAYSKQEMLNDEISRLKTIKGFIDENIKAGHSELPQWLLENGNNFDVLLDEAKKEMSAHLAGNTALLDHTKKYQNLAKTNPKQADVIGFQEKMRFFTATNNKPKVPENPEVHWV